MKLNKGISMVEISFIIFVFGMLATAIFPVIKTQYITGKVEREMPKTFEYVVSNNAFLSLESFKWICQKENKNEMVSDEVCFNRVRVLDNCKNLKNNQSAYMKLGNLVSLVENEQQAETIINKCQTYKEDSKENNKEESHENDEKINMMVESLF